MGRLPPEITPEVFNKFVLQTWHRSALLAYQGYLQCGRGLVVWDLFTKSPNLEMSGYITKEQIEDYNFDPYCIAMVDRYDPEEALVLGIRWQTEDNLYSTAFFLLKIENMPTPLTVYNQSIQN